VSKTVLVVDDEMIICLNIQMQVDAIGHRTLVASTYADAVRIVETGAVDIVVLDWHLSNRSADPLAATLRRKGIPFILCSGSTREELAEVFPNIPVVTKPYVTEQLVAALDVAAPAMPL
jgi:CheY-like chemotaxis protein